MKTRSRARPASLPMVSRKCETCTMVARDQDLANAITTYVQARRDETTTRTAKEFWRLLRDEWGYPLSYWSLLKHLEDTMGVRFGG